MKNVAIFLIAVLGCAVVIALLHDRLPDVVAGVLGFFVMVLIGYPLQRVYRSHAMPFARWAIVWAIASLIGTAVGFLLVRVF